MRKQSLFTVLIFAACGLAVVLAAYSFTSASTIEICDAAAEQTEESLKSSSGKMLWESLSNQFVSTVHY